MTGGWEIIKRARTLGQHVPHTEAENRWMFGGISHERIHPHDWRGGVTRIGAILAALVAESTGGAADWEIPVDINTMTVEERWDLIINIGHVVPHEVLGFSNHNKNYFIGLGGKETICASHMAAAVYGIENNLGDLVSLPGGLLGDFDTMVREKGYSNRSLAVADMIRAELAGQRECSGNHEIAVTITEVYDHDHRGVQRLWTQFQDDPRHEVAGTLHVHLDRRHCLDVIVLSFSDASRTLSRTWTTN
jgi:metal-responsive CopG/Arc/MetJ family transcriptional regulator